LEQQSIQEAELADRLAKGLRQSAEHVHLLSRGLIPVEIDAEGLQAALITLASSTSAKRGVRCEYQSEGPIKVADNFVATHLFRIAQEAVVNALRHGQADWIVIRLEKSNFFLTLEVRDNGLGISEQPAYSEGAGLRIMRYRAGLIGGSLHVESGNEGGTQVSCTVLRGGSLP
jgi:signal transduction histidine kinase